MAFWLHDSNYIPARYSQWHVSFIFGWRLWSARLSVYNTFTCLGGSTRNVVGPSVLQRCCCVLVTGQVSPFILMWTNTFIAVKRLACRCFFYESIPVIRVSVSVLVIYPQVIYLQLYIEQCHISFYIDVLSVLYMVAALSILWHARRFRCNHLVLRAYVIVYALIP